MIFINVDQAENEKHSHIKRIVAKKFKTYYSECIIFLDVETETNFCFTVEKHFSKKNVKEFLETKFKKVEL